MYEAIIGQVGPKMAKDSQEWPRMAKDGQGWPRTEDIKTDTLAKIRCCFLLVIRVVCYSHYWPFHSQDLITHSPYYLPCNSYDACLENLIVNQLISWLIFLSFHHLFALYWINTVKRNSVLVTHGKIKKTTLNQNALRAKWPFWPFLYYRKGKPTVCVRVNAEKSLNWIIFL